jgi:hypothetical protein
MNSLHEWAAGIAKAVAVAAVLGGGGAILTTKQDVAVIQADRANDVARLERIENKIDRLIERGSDESPRH